MSGLAKICCNIHTIRVQRSTWYSIYNLYAEKIASRREKSTPLNFVPCSVFPAPFCCQRKRQLALLSKPGSKISTFSLRFCYSPFPISTLFARCLLFNMVARICLAPLLCKCMSSYRQLVTTKWMRGIKASKITLIVCICFACIVGIENDSESYLKDKLDAFWLQLIKSHLYFRKWEQNPNTL